MLPLALALWCSLGASASVPGTASVSPPPPAGQPSVPPPAVDASLPVSPPPGPRESGSTHFRGALELLAETFPSGTPGGAQDLFGVVSPALGFDGGEDFGFALGAVLRLRLFDDPPAQKALDFGGLLRREDWDQLSDYGQVLRQLRIGREGGGLSLEAGALDGYTLGHGHLVSRYTNQLNPDYHPAGATAEVVVGPTRTQLLASDLLGARLFGLELSADMARILGDNPNAFDRYHLAFSFVHDVGEAGYRAPPLSLLHLDFDLSLHKDEKLQVMAFAGIGSRVFVPSSDLGGVVGLGADGQSGALQASGKLELRKQSGGFRQGMVGPVYELSRFAGLGFTGAPLAEEQLPNGFSGFGEISVASAGPAVKQGRASRMAFTASLEHFSWGRSDFDAQLSIDAREGRGSGALHVSVVGLGQLPRYLFTGEARLRFAPALYAVVTAGTVFFPQPDSSLVRGLFGGLGLGADFAR